MNNTDIQELLAEDSRRRELRARKEGGYDPLRGLGCCGDRTEVRTPLEALVKARVPVQMTADADYPQARADATVWRRLRCRYDFEFWCATCVKIKHKTTGADVPFVLNAPQRAVLAIMEADRRAGLPVRVIMLKARQWGGSTLVQMYMAWIQSCICRNWHSLICAHVKDAAAGIRGMYTKMLAAYPEDLWEGDEPPRFRPFERSVNVREIAGRGCKVTVGSAENPDAVRSYDYAMAHLSETAFWPATRENDPADLVRAVCGSIALIPNSLVVMESTANGVGSYFHSEWLRCRDGHGDKHAVFVPWYDIEIYRLPPADPAALAASMDAYERSLWDRGLCLDQIAWYRSKRREYADHTQMKAEYPTTDDEAFMNTGRGVFANTAVETLRRNCRDGIRGELGAAGFKEDPTGALTVWEQPARGCSYVAAVDVGGRSAGSDWSVIAVVRRGAVPEVVAQWRGHIDHDLLVDRAEAIARYYNRALLIIESNTLEAEAESSDSNLFVLSRLAERYHNLYRRRSFDRSTGIETTRIGFHTNRSTKALIISGLIAAVRDGLYIERDAEACNEMATYEQLDNGGFAAKIGRHDDIVMTRALALHAVRTAPDSRGEHLPLPAPHRF